MTPVCAILLISGGIHQAIHLSRVRKLDLEHPGSAERIGVHLFGGIGEVIVDCNHFPGNGSIDIGSGFNGFDCANGGVLFDGLANSSADLNKNDIRSLFLGVIRNAKRGNVSFDEQPFVRASVLEICLNFHFFLRDMYELKRRTE